LVIQIRAARLAAQRLEERARRLTERVLLLPSGGSVRDLALLVGLSHTRGVSTDAARSDEDDVPITRLTLTTTTL